LRITNWDRKERGKRKDAKGGLIAPQKLRGVQIPEKEKKEGKGRCIRDVSTSGRSNQSWTSGKEGKKSGEEG